jgi:Heterokaryon incompatibility protein (HET)
MATIHEEADFTIVAAAGSGASYGLPGVRSTPRKPQPKFKLESGSVLVSTLRDPSREILELEWYTRGWTYQEGILSNRRLVFTDHQVYWECLCMAIHDSIYLPLHLVHEASGTHMANFMLAGIFKGDSYGGGAFTNGDDGLVIGDDSYRLDYGFPIHGERSTGVKLRGPEEHIRAFSMRKLSYDKDFLTAFLGITGLYGLNDMIYPFLGIPCGLARSLGDGPVLDHVCSFYLFMVPPQRPEPSDVCFRAVSSQDSSALMDMGRMGRYRLVARAAYGRTLCDHVKSDRDRHT